MSDSISPIKAVYAHLDCLIDAVAALKKAGYRDMHVLTPFPRHEVEELIYEGRPSPVRWFTLIGGCFGATMAFSLCSFTHSNWPMILPGGKPVVSIPPFMVITFEGTILWGALATLVGLLTFCGLPATNLPKEVEDPRFTNDHFGIVLPRLVAGDADKVKDILNRSGAVEVTGGAAHA